nr:GNAT family protein [Acinetobacter populi]
MNEMTDFLANGVVLSQHGVRLEPLDFTHADGLAKACQDGELWTLRVTSTPHYTKVDEYIAQALEQKNVGSRFAFAVIDIEQDLVIGTSSYHDIVPALGRVEIGYTWYAKTYQRTHVNTTCKFLLLQYAFEVLKVNTVGFRTDQFNFASQKAIERLGAKKDGVIRGHALRKDGSIRDTVMYSIVNGEWTNVKAHLSYLLQDKY